MKSQNPAARCGAVVLLSALCFAYAALADEKAPSTFIEQHCTDCHDAAEKKGNLDLTALKPQFTDAETFAMRVKGA